MAKHKTLQSVVRSVADQFAGDDFVMSQLVRLAYASNQAAFDVDVLTGIARPQQLVTTPVAQSVERLTRDFPSLVHRSNSDMSFVRNATLRITFDLQSGTGHGTAATPYTCDVTIVDDRGKTYAAKLEGRWIPARAPRSAWALLWQIITGRAG